MTNYYIVPGLGNSGPDLWQTYFEHSGYNFTRINQQEWNSPDCADWISNIDEAVKTLDPATVVLIGHSLGCLAIVHWAARYKRKIKGALLVAPSDSEAQVYTFPATGFALIPFNKLAFKTIVVASANDVWVSLERAAFFATQWGSEFTNLGNAGHINVSSGHSNWDEGLELLETFN